MRLCIKVGGALVETTEGRARLAAMLRRAITRGEECILVHGGGKQIAEVATRLGLEERRHEGLRITDAATARVVTWVLAGEVNKGIVAALVTSGIQAIGICGADLGFFTPTRKTSDVDLGYVGTLTPNDVDGRVIDNLLASLVIPVVATIGPEQGSAGDDPFLNVNADEAAGPIAAALRCDLLLLLSDIPGVLDKNGDCIEHIDEARAHELIQDGTIRGGMIPKIRAALDACRAGVGSVRIAPLEGDTAIEDALAGRGTEIRIEDEDAKDITLGG
ncbi:MAG: acetylglutamate kinase [Planctomycetes bacterium]|nr:acetylglutamate kinase [Planctomycetota bacterium]